MVWQLIYALQHNARDAHGYQKIMPPNDDIRHFFQSLQPIYEEANQKLGYGDPTLLSTGPNNATIASAVPKKKKKVNTMGLQDKTSKVTSHYNNSWKDSLIITSKSTTNCLTRDPNPS